MKDKKRYILKDAIVLMIVSAMVLSAIPAVTADGNDSFDGNTNGMELTGVEDQGRANRLERIIGLTETSMAGGFGVDAWLGYNDGSAEVYLGVSSGADYCAAVELSDVELASYRDHSITDVYFASDYSVPFDIWIENTRPADPILGTVNVVASGTTPGSQSWMNVDVVDTPIPDTGSVWIGVNFYTAAIPGAYPWAIDTDTHPAHDRGDSFYYTYYGGWATLSTDLPTYDGVNCIDIGVSLVEEPEGECLPDQCDFEIVSINNIPDGMINSLPHIINITIRNNGEVGIAELKLLADVYEKVCGPTTQIVCDKVYELCDWEDETADDFTVIDDGDGDSWVLQGGAGNRWLTNDQAWRNTKGEDRSYGGDEDVYLGLSPGSVGYDELIWHVLEQDVDGDGIIDFTNDISGAACATFTFSYWCEGEYTFDEDDNVIPVDYGTIAYRLDGGAWIELPITDFVAYDSEGDWIPVTLKFINTAIYPAYSTVCDDCTPGEDDIVIEGDFPAIAKLEVKFIWHKDVCCQYEGWYIDELCLERTEMYELLLVHQTHEIISLDPCVGAPEDIYYEFPLGFDPDPDTWYRICILGQVFDCPDCCEQIFENNEMCIQFFVTDIHDMQCVDITLVDPDVLFYRPGDSICVDMTVKNMGTFAENNVPVDLKVGKRIVDATFVDGETDPFTTMGHVNFGGGEWFARTTGRTDIENIGTGLRSIEPGSESIIFALDEIPYAYFPQTPEGAIDGLAFDDSIDPNGLNGATLSFYAKWSLPYYDNYCSLLIHPDWAGNTWYIDEDINGEYDFMNEWYYFEFDLMDEFLPYKNSANNPDPSKWPIFDLGFIVYTLTNDGTCVPPANPYPWSGLMLDNINLELITCGEMIVVDTQYTGPLAPGQEETITLCWNETEFCSWCLCGDINLVTDIDPTNDICCVEDGVRVRDSYPVENWKTWDLTGDDEGDCLWHICCTRSCDGTCCAWAGVEEEHWCHYVNDMDYSMISPEYNLSAWAPYGVSLNFTTWYDFVDEGDFGEVWVRRNASNPWVKVGDSIEGTSLGLFEYWGIYIPEEYCSENTQFKFRIVTDDEGMGEGWYVCNVCIVDVVDLAAPPVGSPGDTIFYQTVLPSTNTLWSFINIDDTLGYAGCDNFQISDDVTIGGLSIVALALRYSGGWVAFDPVDAYMECVFYDDPYAPFAQPTDVIDTFYLSGAGADSIVLTGDSYSGYPAYEFMWTLPYSIEVDDQDGWMYLTGPTGYSPLWGNSFDGDSDRYQINAGVWGATGDDSAFGLYEGQPNFIPVYGDEILCDDFDREFIAPWTCERTIAGNYWDTEEQIITGYPSEGKGLNNAMYTLLDFTDPELSYVEFSYSSNWSIEADCHAYVEVSPNWDGVSPMDSATWVVLWYKDGPSVQDEWVTNSFMLNQYLGQEVYLRFRYTTPGNGFATNDGFWNLSDKQIIFKLQKAGEIVDTEPPVTNIFFDCVTAKVTLVATDYPLIHNSGVKATYYKIDSGDFLVYNAPVTIPEGTHTIYYYSEDNAGNKEAQKSKSYTVDTTPPTVTLIEPKEGWLYLFGSPIMERLLSDTTLCIGKVVAEATATDTGSGVYAVLFEFDGTKMYADSSPYTATWNGMKFGDLTISAKAIDNGGLESAPDTITVKVYSLGLF